MSANLTRPLYTKKRRIKRMQIVGIEGIYKVTLFQAIFLYNIPDSCTSFSLSPYGFLQLKFSYFNTQVTLS